MENKRHPFSYTLGPGPYTFTGVGKIHMSETYGSRYIGPEMDGGCGTCSHCGHAIMSIYIVKTGEGKRLGVGSDCINKILLDGDFTNVTDLERELRRQKRVAGQIRREKQRQNLKLECENLIKNNKLILVSISHPSKKEMSAWDYCEWYLSKEHTLGGYKIMKQKLKQWGCNEK